MKGRKRVSIEAVSIDDVEDVDFDFGVVAHPDDNANVWYERMALERIWREEQFPLSPFPWERKLDVEDLEAAEAATDRAMLPKSFQ